LEKNRNLSVTLRPEFA